MIQSLGAVTRFGYAFLYLPAANFGYLFLEVGGKEITGTTPTKLQVLGYVLDLPSLVFSIPKSELPYYAIFTMIGGIWLHQYSLYVHGHEGPSKHPKDSSVAQPIMTSLAFGVDIDQLPRTPSKFKLVIRAVEEASWGGITRFILFMPAGLFKPMLYLSAWLLWTGLPAQSFDIYGGVLIFASSLLIIKEKVNDKFPSFVPPAAVDSLKKSEYQMAVERANKEEK